MYERRASAIAVLLAGIAFLAAGCSSSSSPTSAASSPPAATTPATPTAAADALPAADCAILKPISASAISTLTPIASDSKAKAAAAMKSYIAELETAEGKLTSAQAKADLEPLITGLEKSATETQAQSTPVITAALGKLGAACP
jgi:type IV pilus biogenesis protein CpaD/CtpE